MKKMLCFDLDPVRWEEDEKHHLRRLCKLGFGLEIGLREGGRRSRDVLMVPKEKFP